ncbi:hypothetical protein [Streptomyces sp. NPDC020983]|uniref:hypothetical protein n=1 Tax=Streptomyces sp. NPDC020983 TaxID=3365106 RepID=UPI0037AC4323
MSLREIKDRVDREHPDWTPRQRLEEIDRLRKTEKAARATARTNTANADTPPANPSAGISVRGAWAFLVITVGGMEIIGLATWGNGQPDWYNSLHGGALVLGVCAVVGAYKRRATGR